MDNEPECENCGMIDVPLKDGHCDGCICECCGKTALEAGCSMNDVNWCQACDDDLHVIVEEGQKQLAQTKSTV